MQKIITDYCSLCHKSYLRSEGERLLSGGGGEKSKSDASATSLPLLPGSKTAAQYQYPPSGKNDFSPQSSVSIDYLRLEERMKPSRAKNFYSRQLETSSELTLDDGIWLTSLRERKGEEKVQSVDVIIRFPEKQEVANEEEQELTIEIIKVEIPLVKGEE